MQPSISMSSPDLNEADKAAVLEVLESRHLSIGPKLDAFEQAFAAYTNTRFAVGVNSGTSGLHLTVIAAGVGPGDLVVTTPFSFVASANCILYEGGIPIFVDVDPVTGNIDPDQVAEATWALQEDHSQARRWLPPFMRDYVGGHSPGALKAILPVHAFGQPADMDEILAAAEPYGLPVIEDACEAIGAEYRQRRAGALGKAAVFAFYPNKQMTTGEGGLIVTDDAEWATLLRSLRNQGRDVFDGWLDHARLGYNYRLDEMSAALGLAQLQRIDTLLARREQVAAWYNERLGDVELLELPRLAPSTSRMSWFVYVVRVRPPVQRDEVMRRLAAVGVPSRQYFSPIHLQRFYGERFGYQRGDFPITEQLGEVSLALPFSGVMTETQVDYVCERLSESLVSLARAETREQSL